MTDLTHTDLRSGLIDDLRACRDTERAIFAALDPMVRDAPGADGGWSPKDHLAHLSAWRHRQAAKMAALRAGLPEPTLPAEGLDATNAIFHDERAQWSWDVVVADADATADELIAELDLASDEALADQKVIAPIMGDGPEHDLAHLGPIAASVGMTDRVLALADRTQALVELGGWPDRAAAVARYNLACFHALSGNLDTARALLRQVLPGNDELRTLAPTDDDLIALRDEIPGLSGSA